MHGRFVSGHAVSYCTVAIVLCVYASHWYVYHIVCTPTVGWAVLFNVLLFLASWSYVQTCFTDPGTPETPEWKAWESTRTSEMANRTRLENEAFNTRWHRSYKPGEASWCQRCGKERPERAHHCSFCSVCVLRMDHHCPWVGTCVGFKNHKFFVLMNGWTCCASVAFFLTSVDPGFIDVLNYAMDSGKQPVTSNTIGLITLSCFSVSIVSAFITGLMCVYAVWLAARNVTTLEERFFGINPYCFPSSLENITQLLGPLDHKILLPVSPEFESPLAGTCFPTVAGLTALEGRNANAAERGSVTRSDGEGSRASNANAWRAPWSPPTAPPTYGSV
eukprot:TRINITY_DN41548_c0_g1_i1.p1 TRINITY_DN41548_c0_g1~~TRINITY_DN41548_c0_g1_i1.p1  ORF type:complete len:333 (-),score=26.97 TRINITY_DN41548_c0_g1_i1:551-1549(-)